MVVGDALVMLLALAFRAVVRRTGLGQIREVGVVSGCPNKRKREGRVSYVVGVPTAFVRNHDSVHLLSTGGLVVECEKNCHDFSNGCMYNFCDSRAKPVDSRFFRSR